MPATEEPASQPAPVQPAPVQLAQTQLAQTQLAKYRKLIDEIDESLVLLLAKRFEVTAEVGQLKTLAGLAAVDAQRESDHLAHIGEIAQREGLAPEFVQNLLRLIMDEVVRHHNELGQNDSGS